MDSHQRESLLTHRFAGKSFNQDLAPDWMREEVSTGVSRSQVNGNLAADGIPILRRRSWLWSSLVAS